MKSPFGKTAALAAAVLAGAAPVAAQDAVKVGIVSFLSGPAAAPFGIPGKNGAEILVEAINAGAVPEPYASAGLGGLPIEATYVDEAGASAAVVTEFRNLVERTGVDVVIGYISSGNCLAVAPVAEEMGALTFLYGCGTPRIFEEASYTSVFRIKPTATMDNVASARYLLNRAPDTASVSGINQNYAWGQDSWRDFTLTLKALKPEIEIRRELFPKLFAGEYGAEISAAVASGSDVVHTSNWGGDLESLVLQSVARGLPQRATMVMTAGESAMFRLADRMPEGAIIGARGPHSVLAPESPLNTWFQEAYAEKFGEPPTFPSYHMAQAVFALKYAWDKAAAEKGARPTTEEVAAALRGATVVTPSGPVEMALGDGHQGISETAYGLYRYNRDAGRPEIVDVVRYPARCVNPPADMGSVAWIEAGMPGARCD